MSTRPSHLRRGLAALLLVVSSLATALALSAPLPASAAAPKLLGVQRVDVGAGFGCAVMGSGHVACWGNGRYGQIGDGRTVSVTVPTFVTGLDDAVDVVTADITACALREGGTVSCWGNNGWGLLGQGSNLPESTTPLPVVGLPSGIVDIDAGSATICAVAVNGDIWCWGNNQGRQIQDSDIPLYTAPTKVLTLAGAAQVAVGNGHVCARTTGLLLKCWGLNVEGQLGNGTTTAVPAGATVSPTGLTNVTAVAAGQGFTCAQGTISGGFHAACWGSNDFHQVTAAATAFEKLPVVRPGVAGATLLAGYDSACIVEGDADLVCWGQNRDMGPASTPASVPSITRAAVGSYTTCAVDTSTALQCWGVRYMGSLGNGEGTIPGGTPPYVYAPLPELSTRTPARLLDTRPTGSTVDGQAQGTGAIPAGATLTVPVANRGGAGNNTVLALNLTSRNPQAAGTAVLWTCGAAKPVAWTLRMAAHETRTALAIVAVSGAGTVCLSPSVTSGFTLDLVGAWGNASPYETVSPARLVDTRPVGNTVDGLYEKTGKVAGGSTSSYTVNGRGGVPLGAGVVVLNVTSVGATKVGRLVVTDCASGAHLSQHVSIEPGRASANLTFVRAAAANPLCITASVATHLVVDVWGYLPAATSTRLVVPMRIADTRPAGVTVDGYDEALGALGPGAVRRITVVNRGDDGPSAARTMALDVTVLNPAATGGVTVWACGRPKPALPTFTVRQGVRRTNLVLVAVGDLDQVCITSSVTTHAVVDMVASWAY